MKDNSNIMRFMRNRMQLTQKEVSKATNLTINDISRMENGFFDHRMETFIILSKYLKVPLAALMYNDLEAALPTFTAPSKASRKMLARIKALREMRDDISCEGEDWALAHELEKLKGTIYENGVTSFADDPDAHFDLFSFSPTGSHIIIEVKTTTGKAEDAFFITSGELDKARECLNNGEQYEIYRVHHINKTSKRGLKIIPVRKLFSEYEFIPETYKVVRKGKSI